MTAHGSDKVEVKAEIQIPVARMRRIDSDFGRFRKEALSAKRTPPKRRSDNPQLVRRLALGLATFLIALETWLRRCTVSLFLPPFRDLTLENGTTAAIALLIGALRSRFRNDKPQTQVNLLICLLVLAITPWTYQLGNQAAGMDLA